MKNIAMKTGVLVLVFIISGLSLFAQDEKKEESKMVVKVMKAGNTVLDTTYLMDEDFDKEKIDAMIEGLKGDHKMVKVMKMGGEGEFTYDFDIHEEIDSVEGGVYKWVTKGDKEMKFGGDVVIEEIREGEDGTIIKEYIIKSSKGDTKAEAHGEANVMVVKKMGEDVCCEDGELEDEIEIIMGDGGKIHKFHSKDGNVMFFGDDKNRKVHSGNVIIKSDGKNEKVITIESDGENSWTTKEGNVFINKKDGKDLWHVKEGDVSSHVTVVDGIEGNNFMFYSKEKKSHIKLDSKGSGLYRLAFESDELEPIQLEVFDGEGNRLFKKKVKNFYGRFLKDIQLGHNETGLYTVRVLQAEKEIIGEFEYK